MTNPESTVSVLVPGLACSSRLWDPLREVAWRQGPIVIADTRRDSTISAMAERLLSVAPSRFVLAGISLGGYVCHEVIRRAPERVAALALISTSAAADTDEQRSARRQQEELVAAGKFDELVTAAFPTLVAPTNVDDGELATLWSQMAHEVGPEAFVRQLRAAAGRDDSRPTLGSIQCPVAIIHGSQDRLIPVEHARDAAREIPDAALSFVADGGHMVVQEQTDEVRSAFAALYARVG